MGAVVAGLQAALLFARGKVEGLRYLSPDQAGTLRSFWALPLAFPAVICLRLIEWVQSGLPAQPGHVLGLDLMGFVVGWLAFAVITYHLLESLGAAGGWARFITAWNWCNVIENLLLVLGNVPGLLGAPPLLDEAAQLFAVGWALWIEWFAARAALQSSGLLAGMLVVLDQFIGLILASLTYRMMHG